MLRPGFQVTANYEDIALYPLKRPPVHITHDLMYEEIQARVGAGLSQTEYDALPGTPEWITEGSPQISKCHIIAYDRLRTRIDLVFAEASSKK